MTTYKTRLGLDARCIHCNKRPHDHTEVTWECVQERKPYTPPRLRKLDPRCVILKDNVDFFSVAVAHAPNTYSLTTEICHITNCKCEK
jgi:hypothetical protein